MAKQLTHRFSAVLTALVLGVTACISYASAQQEIPATLREAVDEAVRVIKPATVLVRVVETDYREGRENKYEASGSGVIISEDGYVVTNYHVAGNATRVMLTLSTQEEIPGELVGKDPLTDIAVIRMLPETPRTFPYAEFGDSTDVRVGQHVIAVGSPGSLSQSVTLGIVSNAQLVMPPGRYGRFELNGENVGALVAWLAHDAQIYYGNSGGPLVNLAGAIVGINEMGVAGLSGAIPSSVAKSVAQELIASGEVTRAWLGVNVQPLLKHAEHNRGVLVTTVLRDGPGAKAGVESGDLLVRLAGNPVTVRFPEELPAFNRMASALPIGEPVEAVVVRDGREKTLTLVPQKREKRYPEQEELKNWGATARDISGLMALEMKRNNSQGVVITSVSRGGAAADAKPEMGPEDIIVRVGASAIRDLAQLKEVTARIVEGQTELVPTTVEFERNNERYLTVAEVGVKELQPPAKEIKKGWLPAKTQVVTRDMAKHLGDEDLTGFRVTQVFEGNTAAKAGLQVGDIIVSVDGYELEASAPEDSEELPMYIRQYSPGTEAEFVVLRGEERVTLPIEIIRAPMLAREVSKFRDENFGFTVREITYLDTVEEEWKEDQEGVLVSEVTSGGWASLAGLNVGDLILRVNGDDVLGLEQFKATMDGLAHEKPETAVLVVRRGIYRKYVEIEPDWE